MAWGTLRMAKSENVGWVIETETWIEARTGVARRWTTCYETDHLYAAF